ncbi:MAG: hypothetical protein KDC24_14840 [Saprospiraceae bacterium]|nr:hypothetical protein [Saprospiraceae bacterium]
MIRHLISTFFLLFSFCLLLPIATDAQVPDSTTENRKRLKLSNAPTTDSLKVIVEVKDPEDSAMMQKKRTPKVFKSINHYFKDGYPDPGKAALFSLFPGGGQLYNKKLAYVKIPIIYGGLTWLVILAKDNTDIYNGFETAYLAELAGEEHEYSDRNIPAATLKQYRDIYDKRRQQTYIAIGAVYALSIVEAYVTAHLLNFDVDEDLSFRIKPSFQSFGNGQNVGSIGVQIEF